MVEELYIQDKIKNLIEKYQKKIHETINPDNFQSWDEIGFDEKPDGFDTIEEFLKNDNTLDEGDQEAMRCYEEILEDLETLVVLDDPKTEASVEKFTKRTNKK